MERIITKSFARLMGRGTHRGFITFEELNKSLGKRNLSKNTWIFLKLSLYKSSQIYYCGKNNY